MPRTSSDSVRVRFPDRSREELEAELRDRLPALAKLLPLRTVVLFGSWASGRATAFSDIDLPVVYTGPTRDDAYQTVRRCIPLRGLEPHIYTEEEAALLGPTLDRMTETSVTLL